MRKKAITWALLSLAGAIIFTVYAGGGGLSRSSWATELRASTASWSAPDDQNSATGLVVKIVWFAMAGAGLFVLVNFALRLIIFSLEFLWRLWAYRETGLQ